MVREAVIFYNDHHPLKDKPDFILTVRDHQITLAQLCADGEYMKLLTGQVQ